MNHDRILANVAKHISLDENETEHFLAQLNYREIERKSRLLSEGQVCKALHFVHAGTLRAFCIDKQGKESTIMFAVADWWITDMYCFLNNRPAMMFIEAIENSLIYELTRDKFEKLFRDIPKFERFFRILLQNAYTREQLRVIESLTLSAEERYEKFLSKYPQVVQQVTQKQIASYLGITPEFLSTIRSKKAGK